ncbi:MAG: PcfJ domain-containing protein [Alphaproteobacteria bacterium]|nr:PcfJ domain-containing protein [Alphaproteobacteria bacterium]
MNVFTLGSTNSGRIEFLRDGKGIYGLMVARPRGRRHDVRPISFVLRPDKIRAGEIDDGLSFRAALHPLPRRLHLFKQTTEYNLRCALGAAMVERAGMFSDNGEKTASYDRRKYWGLISQAARIANSLIGQLIEEAADKDALRLARRFPIRERAQIYRAVSTSIRFRQLAETFPYLAAHILRMLGTKEVRFCEAYNMVERGAPLRDVANICDVPIVLRKIPPGAVIAANRVQSFLSDHPDFIHAYLPRTQPAIRRWLLAISYANQIGGPFTEWTARHAADMGNRLIEVASLLSDLRDWARASYIASTPAHIVQAINGNAFLSDRAGAKYITRQFDPGMSLSTVIQLSEEWHEAVANGEHENGREFPEPWCPAGSVNGYEIIPITNGADLYREGKAMHHCVGTYGDRVSYGEIYVYSVRENGERIATAELTRNGARVRLGQVRGPCNANVDKKIVVGVRRWLGQQKSFVFPAPPEPQSRDPGCVSGLDDEIPF